MHGEGLLQDVDSGLQHAVAHHRIRRENCKVWRCAPRPLLRRL